MRNKKLIIILSVICCITLLIVLNSVIFSVQQVSAYCYNSDDKLLETKVIENCGIKKGKSIFTLDKSKVTENLTEKVSDIKVVNVEKIFPNRISVNYVKIFEYLEIAQNGKYYFCSNDGKIMRIGDNPGLSAEIITLKTSSPITGIEVGDKFASESSADMQLTVELLNALERLGYYREVVEMIDFIDISKSQYVFIKMTSGVFLECQGSGNLLFKMQKGLSLYRQENTLVGSGTIIVPNGDNGDVSWDPENRYEQITGTT